MTTETIEIAADNEAVHAPPPPIVLLHRLSEMMSARALQAAAQLGVADHLTDGPKRVDVLAHLTDTHAPSLYRLLRFLASTGVFSEVAPETFGHTELSTFLRTDVYGSMAGMALMWGDSWRWQAWGDLAQTIRTGEPAVDRLFGESLFAYFGHQNPEAGKTFSRAMTSFSESVNGPVVDAYDFSSAACVVDVGGAQGSLLQAILAANPTVRGVVLDLPPVIADDRAQPRGSHSKRIHYVEGDFFRSVPAGGDIYLLKFIIHDWSDEECVTILRNCREAMNPGGRVVIVEQIVPPGDAPSFSKLLDLEMLVVVHGRERTEAEFGALFEAAGLTLNRVVPTASPFSVLEGIVPA